MTTEPAADLAACPIGVVPIIWNNVDVPDLREPVPYQEVLDEIRRLGFDGCQFGAGFPEGTNLRAELETRGLRLAEVYAAIPCGVDGPTDGALDEARERLDLLTGAAGEVLVMAGTIVPERSVRSGRADGPDVPKLSEKGWARLAEVIVTVGDQARERGVTAAFHPHTGTFVETPEETATLAKRLRGTSVGICLDTGHYLVGGGDPVKAIRNLADQVLHVHLKDVDRDVLARLRNGDISTFHDALRERIFTELGSGALDLPGVLQALASVDYHGWLMIEQDTSWNPPAEAMAAAKRVLAFALRTLTSPA